MEIDSNKEKKLEKEGWILFIKLREVRRRDIYDVEYQIELLNRYLKLGNNGPSKLHAYMLNYACEVSKNKEFKLLPYAKELGVKSIFSDRGQDAFYFFTNFKEKFFFYAIKEIISYKLYSDGEIILDLLIRHIQIRRKCKELLVYKDELVSFLETKITGEEYELKKELKLIYFHNYK